MQLPRSFLSITAWAAFASGHAVILNVQGEAGSPASVGFQVVNSLPRNCTTISPCQSDTTLIRDAEISANIVNECGRTELQGNIDVGENTENALAAKAVTQVKSGSTLTVTIHQVNADGAGPFNCDMDPTGNSMALTGQTPLQITNNVPGANGLSQDKENEFNMTIQMPSNFTCIGGSTGNICTVRCRNNALAGPFGGCFAVQQVDTTPHVNTPQNIQTIKQLPDVFSQISHNQADLPAAVQANAQAGSAEGSQNFAAANALVGGLPNVNPVGAPQHDVVNGAAVGTPAANPQTPSPAQTTPSTTKPQKANGNGQKRAFRRRSERRH